MTDFLKAYNTGQQELKKLEIIQKEIDALFKDLNNQLKVPTGGRIVIDRQLLQAKDDSLFHSFTESVFPDSVKFYFAIVASNPNSKIHKDKELAKWDQQQGGYPCTISYGSTAITCHDLESLAAALARLLEDPQIAKIIAEVKSEI